MVSQGPSQWPPRSPHEALLSTPGGRERMRRLADRQSPSPSASRLPTARATVSSQQERLAKIAAEAGLGEDDDDDDEDEEVLRLKLEAIEARLKLKKLQAAKTQRRTTTRRTGSVDLETVARPESAPTGVGGHYQAARDRKRRPVSQAEIEVPASPVKKAPKAVHMSPNKLLGIEKKASDVSLRKPRGMRRAQSDAARSGGYLRTVRTPVLGQRKEVAARPLSFNERLASARIEEQERRDKEERIRRARTTGFGVGRQEMESYKKEAVDLLAVAERPPEFSRAEVLGSRAQATGVGGKDDDGGGRGSNGGVCLRRSKTVPRVRSDSRMNSTDIPPAGASFTRNSETRAEKCLVKPENETGLEPYSGLHLSRRILPHKVLARAVSGKKMYMLKGLLRQVKAPDWALPDDECDIVVFAIIASKSDPRSHQSGGRGLRPTAQQERGKYMVMTLCDLEFEVDLFLFDTGFDRFWKLSIGTVIAILNPSIMAPPKGREATGRFSLTINSDDDTILEVGNARDLGYCKSVKKDGQLCRSWVYAKRTEYCEFHTNEAVRKTRANRVELNDMGFGGLGRSGTRSGRNGRGGEKSSIWERFGRKDGEGPDYLPAQKPRTAKEGARGHYHRTSQSHYFVTRGSGMISIDGNVTGDVAERAEREQALKRRLAQQERERTLARQLAQNGDGAGREYMSRSATTGARAGGVKSSTLSSSISSPTAVASTVDLQQQEQEQKQQQHPNTDGLTSVLSLVPKRDAHDVDLGSVKRKRVDPTRCISGRLSVASGHKAPLGWGSILKDKLSRMKDGERLDGRKILAADPGGAIERALAAEKAARCEMSPVRKKTRFVTDKGIREAGRESLGEPLSATARARLSRRVVLDDADDDDLEIV